MHRRLLLATTLGTALATLLVVPSPRPTQPQPPLIAPNDCCGDPPICPPNNPDCKL